MRFRPQDSSLGIECFESQIQGLGRVIGCKAKAEACEEICLLGLG